MTEASQLISWLRAAGEPSRLRLLALCDRGDLSVSDLAQALGQSEPRVCRHLRILSEAGLIERMRNGQWVHYRIATGVPAAGFVKGLLAQLDRSDPVFTRDLKRALAPPPASGDSMHRTAESRLGRALKDFVANQAPAGQLPSALLVGVEHLEVLETVASISSHCVAIAHSRRAAQAARSFAERRRFNCRVLLAASADALCERDLAQAGRTLPFDGVVLDHVATADREFPNLLRLGQRALAPQGWMCLFERYESLEVSRGKVVEHPIARLRRLLADAGLSCERLSPIEADDEHVLAAVAAQATNREQVRHA